jgi:hypothetical protein
MVLDGHEEDPWAECVAASWFLSQGLLKFGLAGCVALFKSYQGVNKNFRQLFLLEYTVFQYIARKNIRSRRLP